MNLKGARVPKPEEVDDDGVVSGPLVEQDATLFSIGGGVANEKFVAEFEKILANIRDPNTEAKAKRRITLDFVFHPSEDRSQVLVAITGDSRLSASKPSGDVIYVGRQDGQLVGKVMQPKFDPSQDPRQGILPLERKGVSHGE